jgi:hypothetical protein
VKVNGNPSLKHCLKYNKTQFDYTATNLNSKIMASIENIILSKMSLMIANEGFLRFQRSEWGTIKEKRVEDDYLFIGHTFPKNAIVFTEEVKELAEDLFCVNVEYNDEVLKMYFSQWIHLFRECYKRDVKITTYKSRQRKQSSL